MTTLSLQPQQVSLVKAGLELRRRALNFGLARYRERLAEFEGRYGFDSQTFIKRFEAGELADQGTGSSGSMSGRHLLRPSTR